MNSSPNTSAPYYSIIVATDQQGLIGRENKMPWNIPEDMAFFREKTLNHNVIMGRKTFLSIGKALDQRTNIVLSRNSNFHPPGAIVVNDLDELKGYLEPGENFVIGGASVFQLFLPLAQKLYLTRIEHSFEGDTFFPEWNPVDWQLCSYHTIHSKTGLDLSFNEYHRITDTGDQLC